MILLDQCHGFSNHLQKFNSCLITWSVKQQIKHQTSASLVLCLGNYALLALCKGKGIMHFWPFVRGIHQSLVDSPHKEPVMQRRFPCHDVIILSHYCPCFNPVGMVVLAYLICGWYHPHSSNNHLLLSLSLNRIDWMALEENKIKDLAQKTSMDLSMFI